MNVLVACEESQRVCIEFRRKGHNAFSCDILDCSGGHPEWHIKADVLPLLNGNCAFNTCDGLLHSIPGKWDLIIAHPPCTYMSKAGARWMFAGGVVNRDRYFLSQVAKEFFFRILNCNCNLIAIENPVPLKIVGLPLPSQKIQPFMFGDEAQKTTCLWLKNLPLLQPTKIVGKGKMMVWVNKNGKTKSYPAWMFDSLHAKTKEERSTLRSKTFKGIAKAMADQWG